MITGLEEIQFPQIFSLFCIPIENCMLSPALLSDWKPDGCNSPVGITDNLYFYDLVLNGYPQTAALEKKKKKICIQEEKVWV